MTEKTTPYDGMDFREMIAELSEDMTSLAEEVYAATKNPPGKQELRKLIGRAEDQMKYYNIVLENHSAGKRDSIASYKRVFKALDGFTQTIIELEKTAT